MAMKLNVEQANELIVSIKSIMNGAPLETSQRLAMNLKEAGENEIIDKVMAGLARFQDSFNDYTESLNGFLKELGKVEELDEIVKKLEVGEVSAADTSFKSTEMDVDAII